ncbi:MAG: ATP-dependent Clp protease ATP-binding subunit, partial [Acidobacteria bacterium]|nr:ATP-dependent Clp protease ATP-binding subunit [Acidobacteriota bacterium]
DSGKPMGSFLLTGPTGVGKTQTAKALSRVLFGETTPLVRFDMNEYADPYAPMRLVGTPEQPEGLLTQALRQTPFCVLLLDEIEKAHPHVFDLLLQVLGEGRLSDALGRVAHFQHCFILLTSNLGVREANQTMGWAETLPNQATAGFRRALESFFRPEFINRLDYVLICEPLVLDDLQHVTGLVLASFWQRSGLKQRICLHEVEPEALAVLARRGFDAQLGARALKRAVESDLVTPLSRKLAEIPSDTPLFLRYCLQAGQPEWEVISLSPQRVPSQDRGSEADWLIFLENYLPALHERLAETAPEGLIPLDQLADSAYFLQKEQITRIQKGLAKARYSHRQGGSRAGESPVLDWSDAFPFASVWTERDLFRVIWPWRAQCERQGLELLQLNYPLSRSLQEAFWLDQSLRALPAQSTFLITSSRPDLASAMQSIFTEALTDLGVKVYSVPGQISVDGLPGVRLLQIQRGWHLILDGKGGLEWVCLGSADHTPANLKRVWQLEGPCIDLASGWIFVEKMSPAAWRSLLLHAFFVEECPWPLST